jgi:hypothetical protein
MEFFINISKGQGNYVWRIVQVIAVGHGNEAEIGTCDVSK